MNYAMPTAIIGLGLLTACGGSGSSVESYATKFAEGTELGEEIENRPLSQPSTLPTSGGARYDGVVAVDVPASGGGFASLIGDVQLDADFANSTIGGQMDDFVETNGTRYDGSITVRQAEIRRDINVNRDFTFENDIDGQLTGNDQTYDVDGQLQGDFIGSGNRYIGGLVSGQVTSNGSTDAFEGEVIAKR